MSNYFFNEYDIPTQHAFVGRNEQLKEVGYDTSGVENTFGKGLSNNGVVSTYNEKDGRFMGHNEQLNALGLNIDDYELMFGEGYVKKTKGHKPKILTFTANADGVSLAFFFDRRAAGEGQQNPNITFQKSTDGGLTWQEHTIGVYDPDDGDTSGLDVIALDEGESVMFKGVNSENFTVGDPENDEGIYVGFYLDGSAAASGDITSLINGVGGGGDVIVQFMQFYSMFSGCTSLTQAPALPATTLASGCYGNMFSGCTSITSHDVATLNNSTSTFQNNSSCDSFTIDAKTPPTISGSTITGLKADCVIYVPAASVDAYKAAQYWSARAAYIQAKPSE